MTVLDWTSGSESGASLLLVIRSFSIRNAFCLFRSASRLSLWVSTDSKASKLSIWRICFRHNPVFVSNRKANLPITLANGCTDFGKRLDHVKCSLSSPHTSLFSGCGWINRKYDLINLQNQLSISAQNWKKNSVSVPTRSLEKKEFYFTLKVILKILSRKFRLTFMLHTKILISNLCFALEMIIE